MDLSAIEDKDLRKSIEAHIAESDTKIADLETQVETLTPDDPEDLVKDAPEEVQALAVPELDPDPDRVEVLLALREQNPAPEQASTPEHPTRLASREDRDVRHQSIGPRVRIVSRSSARHRVFSRMVSFVSDAMYDCALSRPFT